MRAWLFCLLEILVYTFGVMGVCALLVDVCHRVCFSLLGRRIGKGVWYATSLPGAPVHELGHAAMCLLFAHRIEKIYLLPRRKGPACVEHSYNRRNPWAAMGSVFIGLGPLFSCLAVILLCLYFIFPQALGTYRTTMITLQQSGTLSLPDLVHHTAAMVVSLFAQSPSPSGCGSSAGICCFPCHCTSV